MKGRMDNSLGSIVIDSTVIATYAGSVAVECFGIVGMASKSMKDGLVKLLRKENLERGITVRVEDNRISLDFHVIVAYGVSISAVCANRLSEASSAKLLPHLLYDPEPACLLLVRGTHV